MNACDLLVIGSGIAGLSLALRTGASRRVVVVTKKARADSSTNYAQGGIAAVVGADDDVELHLRDTLASGVGLCRASSVRRLVEDGPARVRELIDWGVSFSSGNGGFALGREGGHSRRRILHAADLTGRAIEGALLQSLAAMPSVTTLENHFALELLLADEPNGGRRCAGAVVLHTDSGEIRTFMARTTVLATGGLGNVFRHTTNPAIATGDGLAMAWRAGVAVANLEFVQFHPTALYPAAGQAVLVSEAARGEGAVLRRLDGLPLMEGVHPAGSLATRDVVAQTIDRVMKERNDPHVWLDLSPIPAERISTRFPHLMARCAEQGLDPRREWIPVVPAAHYACGGIQTDDDGCATLPGLMAIGEAANTGVHGANRLASNSLLEAVVYSHRASDRILAEPAHTAEPDRASPAAPLPDPAGPAPDHERWRAVREELRSLMWSQAGIVRSTQRLKQAADRLQRMDHLVSRAYRQTRPDAEFAELRNLVHSAKLVVASARTRRESRGLHYNMDFPYRDNEHFLRDTVLVSPDT